MAGQDDHRHAENGSPSPKPMMLHRITSCMEISYYPLTHVYDSAVSGKSQIKRDRKSAGKCGHPCAKVTTFPKTQSGDTDTCHFSSVLFRILN
jgi:hypothetical protein